MSRTRVWARENFTWTDPEGGRWIITLLWGLVGERLECIGLEMYSTDRPIRYGDKWLAEPLPHSKGPVPLTANKLRALRLGEIIQRSRRGHRKILRQIKKVPQELLLPETATWVSEELALWGGKGRRPDHGPSHYREVAEVYRSAHESGANPTEAVQEHFSVSYSYAAKKVAQARKLGFLKPTTQGQAGEGGAKKGRKRR